MTSSTSKAARIAAYVGRLLGPSGLRAAILAYDGLARLRPPQGDALNDYLHIFDRTFSDVTFVQVGSNDGKEGDPLFSYVVKRGWRGVLIEPVPYLFERLRANYSGIEGLIFENVALGENRGVFEFFRVRSTETSPKWQEQVGTLRKEVLEREIEKWPDLADRIVREQVEVETFEEVAGRHTLQKIDLVHIDAEGSDLAILRTIDTRRYSIRLILFEHKHLAVDEMAEVKDLLESQGFEIRRASSADSLAVRVHCASR